MSDNDIIEIEFVDFSKKNMPKMREYVKKHNITLDDILDDLRAFHEEFDVEYDVLEYLKIAEDSCNGFVNSSAIE